MSILHMPKSATDTICESFIYHSDSGVIVIDGGFESEADVLLEKLVSLGGHVDAWFFTHPHDDHYGAFCRIMEDNGDKIKVDRLYCNFLPDELLAKHEAHYAELSSMYLAWIRTLTEKHGIERITMRRGDVYSIAGTEIHVLREPDESITENIINNSSTVFRMDVNGKRIMFLGDLGVEGGEQLLETVHAGELKSDYVQMAHHGQNGVEKAVYEAIAADICLWNTPTWLWDNMGENGYDTGGFKTVIVRGWMSEIKCKKHYVNMNGPFDIEL